MSAKSPTLVREKSDKVDKPSPENKKDAKKSSNAKSRHMSSQETQTKWIEQETAKGEKMAKKNLDDDSNSASMPLVLKQLESCPAPTRRHTQFLLSGYLGVKTSTGWTRKWQTRFVVLTPDRLYMFKRPPPATDQVATHNGPRISSTESLGVVSEIKMDAQFDVLTPQQLENSINIADSTQDASENLFGHFREAISIDQHLGLIKNTLPNTFQLSHSQTSQRLLFRAVNVEQYRLWFNSISAAQILASRPHNVITTALQSPIKGKSNDIYDVLPYIDYHLPSILDRSAIISHISIHSKHRGISQDTAFYDPNVKDKSIVNSYSINRSIVNHGSVVPISNTHTHDQGHIVSHITPWNNPLYIVLSSLSSNKNVVSSNSTTPDWASLTSHDDVTITMADGGSVTLPLSLLYDITSKKPNTDNIQSRNVPALAPGTVAPLAETQLADALFPVSNGVYNADIHLSWKWVTYPAHVPKTATKKGPIQSSSSSSISSAASATLRPLVAASVTAFSLFLAYNLRSVLDTSTPEGLITLWGTYFIFFIVILTMGKFSLPKRRVPLATDPQAISKHIDNTTKGTTSSSTATTTTSANKAHNDVYHVLEITPIRIIDRHTILGGALLGGAQFDSDNALPLPPSSTLLPYNVSLLKALHSRAINSHCSNINNIIDENGNTISIGGVSEENSADEFPLSDFTDNANGDDNTTTHDDDDDDGEYEVDPVLGKIHVQQWGKWCQSDYRNLSLRGPDYLTNKKKIKIPALPHRFTACFTHIFQLAEAQQHAAKWVDSYYRRELAKARALGKGDWWAPGTPLKYLIVNMLVPGSPNYNFVMISRNTHIYPSPFADHIKSGFQQEFHPSSPDKPTVVYPGQEPGAIDPLTGLINDFLTKDDAYRTAHFKYIPSVAEGAMVVRWTVGQTPVILGNKLKQTYFIDPNGQYAEVDVDVGSSAVAGKILGVVKGYAKTLAIDLNFLLEPHLPEELPEALWGGTRIINIDLHNVETYEPQMGPDEY